MRLRFSIRDLLWLTALVAVLMACWVDHKSRRYTIEETFELGSAGAGTLLIVTDTVTRQKWIIDPRSSDERSPRPFPPK
jgi:hypothetical protein